MSGLPLDERIKAALEPWRADGYGGVSPTTRRLLEFWFKEEHLLKGGVEFQFYRAQRDAAEALVYVYEKCGYRSLYELARGFSVPLQFDPTSDNWAKYCFKMATGSGKTFVMALAVVWQYFNRLHRTDNGRRYTADFLLIAPNLIVLDRLAEAFENLAIYKAFPFIPPEWEADFHLQVIVQNQVTSRHATGTLYVTNQQQLYEATPAVPKNALQEALGRPVVKGQSLSREELQDRLLAERDLLVLNDEAHHVHSDDLEWARAISRIHDVGRARGDQGLVMQLDFSATPYTGSGEGRRFFPHIISDYPLGAAIRDRVVKRPKIGEIENPPATTARDFVKQNRVQIDAGVEVFRQFQRDMKKIGKKPVLFVMTDNTRNADRVGDYLHATHNLPTLVIHTDAKGSITKKDLETAREAARSIDSNEYQAIVSVMMLKEGWDVKNVCVIVPLRSYESSILAEQTLGRGLRRMTPDLHLWEEKLVVIDHPRFRALWQAEIRNEDLDIEITTAGRVYEAANLVSVDPDKLSHDVAWPVLAGGITRDVRRIVELDVDGLRRKPFQIDAIELPRVMYKEKDLLTQRTELQRELAFDYTDRYDVFLTGITKAILAQCAASAHFAELLPKVRDYVERRCFDRPVNLDDPDTVKKLNFLPVREWIRDVFADAILKLQVISEPYQLAGTFSASETAAFHTSEPVFAARKTAFTGIPYPKRAGAFERAFMEYLDGQDEVSAYAKVSTRMPLRIPYHDTDDYLRHYRPDFVIRAADGMWLLETKGAGWDQQANVPRKAEAADEWCRRATELTGEHWRYAKILDDDFARYRTLPFSALVAAAAVT